MAEQLDLSSIFTATDGLLEKPIPYYSSLEQRKQLPITVLFGGDSSERPGSIQSGLTVTSLLRGAGYATVNLFDVTDKTVRTLAEKNRPFGVAFMTMHGGTGEDGTLQGMLDMLGIPYTGSGIAASAVSADKVLFNKFVQGLRYNAPSQIVFKEISEIENLDITFPIVLKPAKQGCSYGVFYVENKEELLRHVPFSQRFSESVILEEYIPGREVSVGLYEDPHSNTPHVLPIAELKLKRPIQDFESKICSEEQESLVETIIPAKLEPALESALVAICANIFLKLNCRGYVRMDFRIADSGEIFVLENNTIPGMLDINESDFPKMLIAGGIALNNFVDLMVEAALLNYEERHAKKGPPSKKEMMEYLGLKSR
jgi:D-alanine-D-alanine ligase